MLPNYRWWPAIMKFQHLEPRLVNSDYGIDVGRLGSRGAGKQAFRLTEIVQKRVSIMSLKAWEHWSCIRYCHAAVLFGLITC